MYFVGGDFIIAQGCTGCSTTAPESFDITEMGNNNDDQNGGQGFGMTMMQTGSNYRRKSLDCNNFIDKIKKFLK